VSICAVPGCGRTLGHHNASGVCRNHTHVQGFCRCGVCAAGQIGQHNSAPDDSLPELVPIERFPLHAIDPVGCRRLWCAVLIQGLREHFEDRRARWQWIGSEGFHTVCRLAGLDPSAVRRWAEDQERLPDPGADIRGAKAVGMVRHARGPACPTAA
jgi:hypothetical protein